MEQRKIKKLLVALVIVLGLVLVGTLGGFLWFRMTHVKVEGQLYKTNTELLDLRGTDASLEHVRNLRSALPGCVIRWDIPFQGERYPDDTAEMTVTTLTEEDIEMMDYMPRLSHVDATQCEDYEAILALKAHRPDCQVDYRIHLGDQALEPNADSAEFVVDEVTAQDLRDAMPYLPNLKAVHFTDPAVPAEDLYALQEEFPQITFTWDKVVMGTRMEMDTTELDFSGTPMDSAESVEALAAYFPNLEKVEMVDCGISNEDMAAYRERVRDKYQVIWGVQVGQAYLRTDEKGFIPSNHALRVTNEDLNNLRFCEGLIAVDLGHIGVGNLSWVSGTPHLKYLIVGDGDVRNKDIVHLSQLKELTYLEIFMSPVTDISPLVECTALEDLNLSRSYVDVEPLGRMPWLKNLWLLGNKSSAEDVAYLHEHLPNTRIETGYHSTCHGRGWRDMQSYRDMRDALGMWYMKG